jgi:23S rRNA (guanosine2251-2'-O)-methyltransferase
MRQRGPRPPATHPPRARPPRKTGWNRKPERSRPPRGDGAVILYGWHTVKAALENPARRIRRLFATENAARRLAEDGLTPAVETELVRPDVIAKRLGPDAVHNGLLAEADPLPSPELDELEPAGIVLVLDQITDPHNVAPFLRTAAA